MRFDEPRIKKYLTLFVVVCFIIVFGITWIGKYGIPTFYSTHGPYQYRLGDMVEGSAYRNSSAGRTSHYHNFPNSIATEYMKRTDDNHRYDILSDIVERKTGNKSNLTPPRDMLLIHLRLGDVIDRTSYSVHEFLKNNISFINGGLYVKPLSYYKGILYQIKEYKIKSVMLVGGFHKPLKSTTKSTAYMHKIKEYFESNNINVYERLQQHDADEDFIYMCNAEYFTPGGGGFSDLVRGVVCFRGKHIVSGNKNSTAECDVVGMWSSSVHQELKPLLTGQMKELVDQGHWSVSAYIHIHTFMMHCSVSVRHDRIKFISAALHFLQKVNKDITIELESNASHTGGALILRALNDTKSAFVAIEFASDFFEDFTLSSDMKSFSCKVVVKPICVLFRNIKAMKSLKVFAQKVEADHELVFEALLYNDIVRTYRFRYWDCEVMSAVFRGGEHCSCLTAKPTVFSQLMAHLQQAPEISVEAGEGTFVCRSFHKPDAMMSAGRITCDRTRHLNTGLNVNVSEFDSYDFRNYSQQQQSVELIFSAKELQAFLGFTEVVDAPAFDLHFSEGGRPMKFSSQHTTGFQTSLVLATIEPHVPPFEEEEQLSQPGEQVVPSGRSFSDNDFTVWGSRSSTVSVPVPLDADLDLHRTTIRAARPEGSTSCVDSAFLLPSQQASEPSQKIRPVINAGKATKRFLDEFSDSDS